MGRGAGTAMIGEDRSAQAVLPPAEPAAAPAAGAEPATAERPPRRGGRTGGGGVGVTAGAAER